MKALENRMIFASFGLDREKRLEEHHRRVKVIKSVVDTSTPQSLNTRCASPSKRIITKQAVRERIIKENLHLAQRIFNIMEGNSDIVEQINDTRHIDGHPGTMNFKQRLLEAQRIHERNMLLASRLDTIQPYYKASDFTIASRPVKKRVHTRKNNKKKSRFARELKMVLKGAVGGGAMTHRSTGHDSPTVGPLNFSKLTVGGTAGQSQSARKADESDSRTDMQRNRPSNVLLEYTKIQDGRVLDVAVLKEPFRDRYAIFGIDVDDGQRYELRLTSDEVSSILDGDMLVTSVDNVEVWMALLNKVTLQRVECFARLPFTSEEVDAYNNSHNNSTSGAPSPTTRPRPPQNNAADRDRDASDGDEVPYHYTLTSAHKDGASPPLSPLANKRGTTADAEVGDSVLPTAHVPSAPAGVRPSGERPVSRVGGSAGAVTSAAGAVRNRHLRSGGARTGGGGRAAGAGYGDGDGDGRLAAVDPVLSLFADAAVDLEAARKQLVTPGFLENATSAAVQLIEGTDDFPEGPHDAIESAATKDVAAFAPEVSPKATSAKKAAPTKPTSQKASGGTRAQAMRAAAVRRRSIEVEQARSGGKPAAAPPAVKKAEEQHQKPLVKDAAATPKPGDATGPAAAVGKGAGKGAGTAKDVDKKGGPCPLKATSAAPSAPSAPQPPASKPQVPEGAPRPKSRLYAQRPDSSAREVQAGVTDTRRSVQEGTTNKEGSGLSDHPATRGSAPSSPLSVQKATPPEAARPKSTARRDVASPGASAHTASRGVSPKAPSSPPAAGRPKSRPAPASPGRITREAAPVEISIDGVPPVVDKTEESAAEAVESTRRVADGVDFQEPALSDSTGVVSTEESAEVPSGEANEVLTTEEGASALTVVEKAEVSSGGAAHCTEAEAAPQEGEEAGGAHEEAEEPSSSQLQTSTVETPLEYSLDFESSSAHAEVFKVHD